MVDLFWVIAVLIGMVGTTGADLPGKRPSGVSKTSGTSAANKLDKFKWQPVIYDTSKKYIYLSFDDGPQHGTMDCYQLMKQEGIKASFFMVGKHAYLKSDGPKIVALIRNSYPQFLLANHSFSHAYNHYLNFYHHPQSAELDFEKAQHTLAIPYKIARLPGNRSWVREHDFKASKLVDPVAHLLDSAGYNVIGWDLEWRFNKKTAKPIQTPEAMLAEVDSAFSRGNTHIPNHLVILSHDRMFYRTHEAAALVKFIHLLKQDHRFIFETVDHYPGIKKPVQP